MLLVAPPVTFEATFPLGLASLATALRSRGWPAEGLDLRLDPDALGRRLSRSPGPSLVVLETSIRNVRVVRRLLAQVRASGGFRTAVVGTAAALHPEAFLGPDRADFAVTGDPEDGVPGLVDLLEGGRGALAGVVDAAGIVGPSEPSWLPGDRLPVPDREVFPQMRYRGHDIRRGPPRAAVETSRGCSLACSFCPVPARYRGTWRGRDPEAVLEEMARLQRDYGTRIFLFEDEQPLGDPLAFGRLLTLVRRHLPGVELQFPNGLRGDLLDRDRIEEMAAAGTRQVAIGVESVSPEVRSRLGRPLDEGHLDTLLVAMRRHGIRVTGYFLAGLPEARGREGRDLARAALDGRFDYVHFSVCWPWRRLVEVPTAGMRQAARWRALAYGLAYGNPRRMIRLRQDRDLPWDQWTALARRFATWVRAGTRGGGGW